MDHVTASVQSLIAGLAPGRPVQDFITTANFDFVNPVVDINPNLFAGGFDWSGVVMMASSRTSPNFNPALVSPRHAIVAGHVSGNYTPGVKCCFRLPDGTPKVVTVVSKTRFNYPSTNLVSDVALIYFDQPVTGAKYYKVVSKDVFRRYMPVLNTSFKLNGTDFFPPIPVLRVAIHDVNGNPGVSTMQISSLVQATDMSITNAYEQVAVLNRVWQPFIGWQHQGAQGGDSGGPSFLIINNEPVLLCSQTTVSGADNLATFVDLINVEMNKLAGKPSGFYKLEHPDLSRFKAYA